MIGRHQWRVKRFVVMSALPITAVLGSGCVVGPNYSQPVFQMPPEWYGSLGPGVSNEVRDIAEWWAVFADPCLTELVEQAKASNLNVEVARLRLKESRLSFETTLAASFPNVAWGSAYKRLRTGEEDFGFFPRHTDLFRFGFDSSWEMDLAGGQTRAIEASSADVGSYVENYRDTLVRLFGEVALSYVELREAEAARRVIRAHESDWLKLQLLIERRVADGLSPQSDITEAKHITHTLSEMASRTQARSQQARIRIALLLDRMPADLPVCLSPSGEIPEPTESIFIGLPVNLIRRRPDVRQAERTLAMHTARIGVATADLYPHLSLSGNFTFSATSLSSLFDQASQTWGVGPSIRWNLFDGGRSQTRVSIEEIRTNEALAQYEHFVNLAVSEVEDQLARYFDVCQREGTSEARRNDAADAYRSVLVLYGRGIADAENLTDAKRKHLESELDLTSLAGGKAKAAISLFKSIGGGWTEPDGGSEHGQPSAQPQTSQQ